MAGAIEAVSSSGGQIMPPVMGAVAFLMSEVTGIKYSAICLAAFVPAALYYVTLSSTVYLTARKDNIPAAREDQVKKFFTVLKQGWPFFIPLIVLMGLLLMNYSVKRSGFFAIVAALIIGFIMNRQAMTIHRIAGALKSAVAGIAPIAAACIMAGIIMDVINITGLGLKISGIITGLANGSLMIALILSMCTSLLLGMGLPTSAAYMILAVLVAPAMVQMGASTMAAHLFILYYGALSTITPPVALSVFAAASIAKSGLWTTGRDAMLLASTGFIIPFIFVYESALLLEGSAGLIAWTIGTAIIGCIILAVAVIGWAGVKLPVWARLVIFPCAILLFLSKPIALNFAGLGVTILLIIVCNFLSKSRKVSNV
jgi:TRAP transporter 4TM/12TM fusion protein